MGQASYCIHSDYIYFPRHMTVMRIFSLELLLTGPRAAAVPQYRGAFRDTKRC